jgi:hypothetical protein
MIKLYKIYPHSGNRHLNARYRGHWIGRGGPIARPPRSPDLNPLDFFLWGYLKSVYLTAVNDAATLRERIMDACQTIRTMPGILECVRNSTRRVEACIQAGGGHFEHFM